MKGAKEKETKQRKNNQEKKQLKIPKNPKFSLKKKKKNEKYIIILLHQYHSNLTFVSKQIGFLYHRRFIINKSVIQSLKLVITEDIVNFKSFPVWVH